MSNLTRRSFLKAKIGHSRKAVRLPWVRSERELTESCTRCHDCIVACPEKIIIKGDAGFPEVDFTKGECTFCSECVNHCPENFFVSADDKPWSLKANINEECLTNKKVICLICREQCEIEAINFTAKIGRVSEPTLSIEECTGCGACVKPCPTNAIKLNYTNEFYI